MQKGEATVVEVARKKLRIFEGQTTYDPPTGRILTGAWLWDAALHLSHWMAADAALALEGKTVLELGAGTGLPGLTAAVLGAARVILTDQALLLPCLRANVAVNGLENRVEVRELTWGSEGILPAEFPDVVLMSDVFYDTEEMAALSTTLKQICGEGTAIFGASEIRESARCCLDLLVSDGFHVSELPSIRRQLLHSPAETAEFAVFPIRAPPGGGCRFNVRRNADKEPCCLTSASHYK